LEMNERLCAKGHWVSGLEAQLEDFTQNLRGEK
jgi:hypothetical protein